MRDLEPIREASYLTAEKARIYRCIMRVFYLEYERMHFQLYKEELMESLRLEYPQTFGEYGMDSLKLDLDMLVEWKNLTPFQDPRRVYSIAEYKNKQYRYAMSEAAVEIERMAMKLENLFIDQANLSTNYFVRMENSLGELGTISERSLKEINEWWADLQADFKALNQNYQDYLREFYTGRTEKILKSVEFVLHKDHFISYLREFIRELQIHSNRIAQKLRRVSDEEQEKLLKKVIDSELAVPRPGVTDEDAFKRGVNDRIRGRWKALIRWFIGEGGRSSESMRVLEITNEIIQKMIQNAALIVQLNNWGISRKSDYLHYINMFDNCADIDEAHRLSAHLFGIQNIRHYHVEGDRSTDSITSSTAEEEPSEFLLRPHTRRYAPRVDRTGFSSKSLEKSAARRAHLERAAADRGIVERFKKDGRIAIEEIDEIVSGSTRASLLGWISEANMNIDHRGRTEDGEVYEVIRKTGECTLHCEDGDLLMPRFELIFEE